MTSAPPSRRATLRRLLLINALALLAIEAVSQVVWRLTAHDGRQLRDSRSWLSQAKLSFEDGLYVPDPACLWRLRPGYEGGDHGERFWGDGPLVINADGMRGPERDPARPTRVLVIGGSHPMGMYVSWAQSYAGQLEQRLRAQGVPAQVLNASAPGYTSWQARRWLETYAEALRPAVIVFDAGVNDTLPLTTEYPTPDNEIRTPPAWAQRTSGWLESAATYRLLRRLFGAERSFDEGTPTGGTRVSRADHQTNVEAVAHLAQRLGAELLVLSQVSIDIEITGRAACVFDEAAFAARRVDICRLFGDMGERARDVFVDPIHANPEGHARIAEAIESALVRRGWVTAHKQSAPPERGAAPGALEAGAAR